jgi:hypothetical protein
MTEQATPPTVQIAEQGPPYVIATERGVRLGINTPSGPVEVPLTTEAAEKLIKDIRRAHQLYQQYQSVIP